MVTYAVPVSDGEIYAHFGHCEQFALIDVDPLTKKINGRKTIPSPGHQPGLLPGWLAQQGADIVLAGGIGQSAINLFNQAGVKVVTGVSGSDPEKAVLDHVNHQLDISGNLCDH